MTVEIESNAEKSISGKVGKVLSWLAGPPLVALGRSVFQSMLARIQKGRINLRDFNNSTATIQFPHAKEHQRDGELEATLTVLDEWFYARIIINGDIGFAESFILGEIEVDDLTRLLTILVQNRDSMGNLTVASAAVGNLLNYLSHTRLANTIKNSSSNIRAHYDLGNELFEMFLDRSMMYSSAVWPTTEDQNDGESSLFDAQMRKIQMMISKTRIKASDHVLEIGTGWGTFAIEAVRQTGCRVTTVTLSQQQKQYAKTQLAKLPSSISGRIRILLTDYRQLPELFKDSPPFDKCVSIEMMEAVGPQFLETYFSVVDKLLHPVHGIMAFQCITMPETRYNAYSTGVDFIQKHIFPGGHCPSVTAIVEAINRGSKGRLIVDNLENIGVHYAKTLRKWRETFLAGFDEKLGSFEKFLASGGEVDGKQERFYSQQFKRKWHYYFSYCEVGFAARTLGNIQCVLTRESNPCLLEGLEHLVSLKE